MQARTVQILGTIIGFSIAGITIFTILFLFGWLLALLKPTSDGEKVGEIVKLSKQGVFFKTYEAEIIRGGFNNGSGIMGKSFDFTVPNEQLVKQVQQAMESQKTVKIHYHTEKYAPLSSDSNATFLDSIEVVK